MPFSVGVHSHKQVVFHAANPHYHIEIARLEVGVENKLVLLEQCRVHPREDASLQLFRAAYYILLLMLFVTISRHTFFLVNTSFLDH